MGKIIQITNYKQRKHPDSNKVISILTQEIQKKLILLDPICEHFILSIKKEANDYVVEFSPVPGKEKIEYYNSQFLLVGASIHICFEIEQCTQTINKRDIRTCLHS